MVRAELKALAAVVCLMGLTACDKYMDRRDQVTFGSGDAIAANKAAQIIDPWPVNSRTISHGMRGEQAEAALAKLRKREAGDEGSAQGGQGSAAPSLLAPAPVGQQK
jgi:hypothetical protein